MDDILRYGFKTLQTSTVSVKIAAKQFKLSSYVVKIMLIYKYLFHRKIV